MIQMFMIEMLVVLFLDDDEDKEKSDSVNRDVVSTVPLARGHLI